MFDLATMPTLIADLEAFGVPVPEKVAAALAVRGAALEAATALATDTLRQDVAAGRVTTRNAATKSPRWPPPWWWPRRPTRSSATSSSPSGPW